MLDLQALISQNIEIALLIDMNFHYLKIIDKPNDLNAHKNYSLQNILNAVFTNNKFIHLHYKQYLFLLNLHSMY